MTSTTSETNINVRIVADSINPHGKRIISALWTYPRFIHAEIMTHRQFSRNAASSRAIPVKKIIDSVRDAPAMPEFWGKNQSGMQAHEELDDGPRATAQDAWEQGRFDAIATAKAMLQAGAHKQIANRCLEPWFPITVLVTSTEWANFFTQRAHPAAQPEFQVLAYRMLHAYLTSVPIPLDWGEWHLPFDIGSGDIDTRTKISVACAARTSYVSFDQPKEVGEQVALYDRLLRSGHWSPFEHQAKASASVMQSGNFKGGWSQLRQRMHGHTHEEFDPAELMDAKPDWITV